MMDAHVPSDMLNPFLRRAVELGQSVWQKQAVTCFESKEYIGSGLAFVLTLPDPPQDLVDLALRQAGGYSELIEALCLRGQVREDIVRQLLCHPDRRIMEAAAHGEWYADPEGHVRQSLLGPWRRVVINSWCDYWVKEVLEQNHDLAVGWLLNHLDELPAFPSKTEEDTIGTAVRVLDLNARTLILTRIPPGLRCLFVIKALVGNELTLYQELLANESLAAFHLVPLSGIPDELWMEKAQIGLTKFRPQQIAEAAFSTVEVDLTWGNMSDYWREWVQAFGKVSQHPDERISEIGRVGKAQALRRYKSALADERNEAIYGW